MFSIPLHFLSLYISICRSLLSLSSCLVLSLAVLYLSFSPAISLSLSLVGSQGSVVHIALVLDRSLAFLARGIDIYRYICIYIMYIYIYLYLSLYLSVSLVISLSPVCTVCIACTVMSIYIHTVLSTSLGLSLYCILYISTRDCSTVSAACPLSASENANKQKRNGAESQTVSTVQPTTHKPLCENRKNNKKNGTVPRCPKTAWKRVRVADSPVMHCNMCVPGLPQPMPGSNRGCPATLPLAVDALQAWHPAGRDTMSTTEPRKLGPGGTNRDRKSRWAI